MENSEKKENQIEEEEQFKYNIGYSNLNNP